MVLDVEQITCGSFSLPPQWCHVAHIRVGVMHMSWVTPLLDVGLARASDSVHIHISKVVRVLSVKKNWNFKRHLLACYLASCGMLPSVLMRLWTKTAQVTFGDVGHVHL